MPYSLNHFLQRGAKIDKVLTCPIVFSSHVDEQFVFVYHQYTNGINGGALMMIENFKEFLVLAEAGNYLEAAESLFISQATLSRHIRTMEEELGTSLFNRLPRKVELSKSGVLFVPFARQIAEIEERYTAELARKFRDVNRVLTIGSLLNISQYGITELLADFKTQYPEMRIEVIAGSTDQLKMLLRKDKCDFAFVKESDSQKADEFTRLKLSTDPYVAVLPSGHPLANAGTIRLEQLRNETFLLPPEKTTTYKVCMDACRKAGFEPHLTSWGHSGRNIFDLVGRGHYVSFFSKRPSMLLRYSKTILVDITPTIYTSINLIYKKDCHSAAGERLVSFVQSYLKRTEEQATEASGGPAL
jgi:LysR family transcriptional activator of glutamate synthase operon